MPLAASFSLQRPDFKPKGVHVYLILGLRFLTEFCGYPVSLHRCSISLMYKVVARQQTAVTHIVSPFAGLQNK